MWQTNRYFFLTFDRQLITKINLSIAAEDCSLDLSETEIHQRKTNYNSLSATKIFAAFNE